MVLLHERYSTNATSSLFFFNFNFIYLFIYLWMCWVFVSVRGLSLVAASGGHSSSRCAGLSLSRPLLLRSTGSRRAGSVIVAHGPSCSAACEIFPDQGSNPCPLHRQADSQPLRHQGSPSPSFWCLLETRSQITPWWPRVNDSPLDDLKGCHRVWFRTLKFENIICSYRDQNFVDPANSVGENFKEKSLQN